MPGYYDPLIPKEAFQGLQDAIDPRQAGSDVLEARLRGFGSGALEGLRSLSSPQGLSLLATVAAPMLGGMGAAAKAIPAATRVLPRAVTMPAEFTKAVSPLARYALPEAFGGAATAGPEVAAGMKAVESPWQVARAAEQFAKWVGR